MFSFLGLGSYIWDYYIVQQLFSITIFEIILIFPLWRIMCRLGLPRWFSIVLIVPVINIGMAMYIAYCYWPGNRPVKRVSPPNNRSQSIVKR